MKNPLSITHPHLIEEWDFDKNIGLSPEKLTYGSGKKAWWVCKKCKHSWITKVNNRTSRNSTNCPACSGQVATHKNNLIVTHPFLVEEWDYVKNKNISPKNISYGCNKKVWWKCRHKMCGYTWKAVVSSRTKENSNGCPACSGRVPTDKNNFEVRFPDISEEWHQVKNGKLEPSNFTPASNKKVWWECKVCGYSWKASINNRTHKTNPKGCPQCAKGRISKKSQKWLDSLEVPKKFREKYFKGVTGKCGIIVDAYDPKTNTVYEFLGDYWHGNPERFCSEEINPTTKRTYGDLYKETVYRINKLKDAGYNVVYIWESDFK